MSAFYQRVCGVFDRVVNRMVPSGKLHNAWHHEAGPKTVFFWAPAWKWSLVVAGLSDLARPAHKLSLNNSVALVANGAIYTRWYWWAIQPKNAVGAFCSFFLVCTGILQSARRYHYDTNIAGTPDDPALIPDPLD